MTEIFDWLREQIEEKSVEENNVAVVRLHNAIVAVNRAELKWKEDCCEWKLDYEGDYETSCNHIEVFTDSDLQDEGWEFCPYCGKRLKVVE